MLLWADAKNTDRSPMDASFFLDFERDLFIDFELAVGSPRRYYNPISRKIYYF